MIRVVLKTLLFISLLCSQIVFSGCESNSNDNTKDPTPISNKDTTADLKGIDTNNNGIRDDIDNLIETRFSQNHEIKAIAEKQAIAIQELMVASTKQEALVAAEKISHASACMYKTLSEDTSENQQIRRSLPKEIEALTVNTEERFLKYIESNKLLSGELIIQASEPICD